TKTPAKRRMPVVITAPYRECRAKVLCDSWWKSNSRNCRFAWVATWATQRVTAASKPQGQKSMNDRLATVRAATRVKPEQASKAVPRGSSRPDTGEDQWCECQRTEAHGHARRGIGHSTYRRHTTQRGRSALAFSAREHRHRWWRRGQKSEEPIRARKPGNAGRAKGLWFGMRHNETNERGLA